MCVLYRYVCVCARARAHTYVCMYFKFGVKENFDFFRDGDSRFITRKERSRKQVIENKN